MLWKLHSQCNTLNDRVILNHPLGSCQKVLFGERGNMGMMIVASFIVAPIAGTLLALRFKVFILIPATLACSGIDRC